MPAYTAFLDNAVDSIEVEKYADIDVLDKDLPAIPAAEILDTPVLHTIVAGELVYRSQVYRDILSGLVRGYWSATVLLSMPTAQI